MKFNKKEILKNITIILATIIVSFALGLVVDDHILGPLTLIVGFLNAYYMAIGKWENYIFGILFTMLYTYICTINGLYGWLIFCLIVYLPTQIIGIINWFNHKKDDKVETRNFTFKNSIIICSLIILGSVILGLLLSLIPSQKLPFFDSTSQIINICGIVLGIIRFRECWYIWIANNTIDLVIWIINFIKGTAHSEMTLITSIMYLVMNIIGLTSWIKIGKRQKEDIENAS